MKFFFNLMLLCTTIMCFSACSKDKDKDFQIPFIEVDNCDINVDKEGGYIYRNIKSNTSWEISSESYYS